MTYLELCQKVWLLCNMVGSTPATMEPPANRSDAKIAAWVSAAWDDIASRREWTWLWRECEFDTQGSDIDYTGADAGVARWLNGFMVRDKAAGLSDQRPLPFVDRGDLFAYGAYGEREAKRPRGIVEMPDKRLRLLDPPDTIYTITAQYYAVPTPLTGDADVPAMPGDLHMLIVYEAMRAYSGDEDAPEVLSMAVRGAAPLWAALHSRCTPSMRITPAPIA